MTTYTTEQILKQFNIHELRAFARAYRLNEDFGKRATKIIDPSKPFEEGQQISISEMPFNTLLGKIAERFNVVYTTDPAFKQGEKLDTKFMLDQFNMAMLHGLVKQQTIATIKVKGASKSTLVEQLSPIYNFWLIPTNVDLITKPAYVPKEIEADTNDMLLSKIKARIQELKDASTTKTNIIKKVKEELKKSLEFSLDNTTPSISEKNDFYELIQNKKQDLITEYEPKERKRMNKDEEGNVKISDFDLKVKYIEKELSAYVRKYVALVPDLIDLKAEKLSYFSEVDLATQLKERAQEAREVQKQASRKQQEKLSALKPEELEKVIAEGKGKRGRKVNTTKQVIQEEPKTIGRPKTKETIDEKIMKWKAENLIYYQTNYSYEDLDEEEQKKYKEEEQRYHEYIDSLSKRKYVKRTQAEKDAIALRKQADKEIAKQIKFINKQREEAAKEAKRRDKEIAKKYKDVPGVPKVRKSTKSSKSAVTIEPIIGMMMPTEADEPDEEFLAFRQTYKESKEIEE